MRCRAKCWRRRSENSVFTNQVCHHDSLATFAAQEREFIPHVTLARSQTPGDFETLSKDLAAFSSADFEVTGLSLYESTSEVYRVVHAAALRA